MSLGYDYHVHSNYSDGRFLGAMIDAAAEAGLDGVGFADHCNVSARESMRAAKRRKGFNLDATYGRRRRAIESFREERDVRIFDAVELDYDPRDEAEIRTFLDEADFDYALGSVHAVGCVPDVEDADVQLESAFAHLSEAGRRSVVDDYFDRFVALVESELFEVAAHADLVERNPALRGYATRAHYERAADALAGSRTVPEINAGRIHREYGEFHPGPTFTEVLLDRDVSFTVGSDSHTPRELVDRAPPLEEAFEAHGATPVRIAE